MPDFDDERLFVALREFMRATEALQVVSPQGEPRLTLDLAEHKSLSAMALRRRLIEMGWTPPLRRADAEPRATQPSSGQAPPTSADRDIDV